MAKFPTCGKEVETPIMKWDMGKNKRYMLSSTSVAGKIPRIRKESLGTKPSTVTVIINPLHVLGHVRGG